MLAHTQSSTQLHMQGAHMPIEKERKRMERRKEEGRRKERKKTKKQTKGKTTNKIEATQPSRHIHK